MKTCDYLKVVDADLDDIIELQNSFPLPNHLNINDFLDPNDGV